MKAIWYITLWDGIHQFREFFFDGELPQEKIIAWAKTLYKTDEKFAAWVKEFEADYEKAWVFEEQVLIDYDKEEGLPVGINLFSFNHIPDISIEKRELLTALPE